MDPHRPRYIPQNPKNNHTWNGDDDEEEDDWNSDDQSTEEEENGMEEETHTHAHHYPHNSNSRGLNNNAEQDEGFADDFDDEDMENNVNLDEDDEDMEGYPGWQQANGSPHQQLEQQEDPSQQPLLNGSSQTETSSGEDGRNYYNGEGMYAEGLNEQVGVGGEEEFESPTEENRDPSDQEVTKTGDYESGYNENELEQQGFDQGKDKDAEKMVPIISKGGKTSAQKRKSLAAMGAYGDSSGTKKTKKKNTNVWTKPSSRKGGKKNKAANNGTVAAEDSVNITPVPRVPDKLDDSTDMRICLSKIYKAEKVELSDDRLSASSTKGYRMVRATRGVVEGAWYFEIKIVNLGETGHTRLGWSTEKGDVQAPVGYDANSYAYRDVDGSKVHKAIRETYGDGAYKEGDVIGFYISLPNGSEYAPKPPRYVWYRNQLHILNNAEEPPKIVPGSEIVFYRNGKSQGVAFKDIIAGRYYPAASMYTLPNQPPCTVQFNFGPTFDCFPEDFGDCPLPKPMYEAPYCGIDGQEVEQGEPLVENGQTLEKKN